MIKKILLLGGVFTASLFGAMDASTLYWASDAESDAPYIFHDINDYEKIIGFEVEIVDSIAQKIGKKTVFVQNDWDSIIAGLQRGHLYDIAINGIDVTPDKQRFVNFSIPYYITYYQLVVRADNKSIHSLADCAGKSVGTLKCSNAYQYLEEVGNVDIRDYTSEVNGFSDLKIGRIDAVLFEAPIDLFYAEPDTSLKKTGGPIGKIQYAIAVRKDDKLLLSQINRSLYTMQHNGELRKILERWKLWNPYTAAYLNDYSTVVIEPDGYNDFLNCFYKNISWAERFERYFGAWPFLLDAAWMTMKLSFVSMIFAISLGFFIAIIRVYGPMPIQLLSMLYIEIVRGTPLLIQMLFIFYGLPLIGVEFSPFVAGILALGINYSAYEAENYRAGLLSVHRGQMEAARALGMTHNQALRYVIIPQAIRFVIPPVTNDFISLLKDSSLVSVITIVELTKAYQQLTTNHYDYFGMGILVAAVYLLLGLPFVRFSRWAEKRLTYRYMRHKALEKKKIIF